MSFNVLPRALRFADADAELAEFEVKRGLMQWVSEKSGSVRGLMEYANIVCAAGDSLFGGADLNMVDFVHHTMEMYDSSCWKDTVVTVVGDYLVVAPANTDLFLYEKDIRETTMGKGSAFDCSVRARPQCPVCLWHGKVRKHCSTCWSRNGVITMALLSVDFPFYIHDDMVDFVQSLGLGTVIRSVDGITRWWVKLDVATYFKVQDDVSLDDCLTRYTTRRDGLLRVAVSLFESGRVVLTSSPSVSALTALVREEGERVGPLVFAMALALHSGVVAASRLSVGAYSVFASQSEALAATEGSVGARMESLSLLAQLQLTSGSSFSGPVLPSRFPKFLTAGYFSGMCLEETGKYLSTLGMKLTANMRELSVEKVGTGIKTKAGGTKRRSTQGLSPTVAQFAGKLHTDVRALSPNSDSSEMSWSGHVSPASSVTTLSSVSGPGESLSLDALTVTNYVAPSVEADVEQSEGEDVDGHVLGDQSDPQAQLLNRKGMHQTLFDVVKHESHGADYVEQTAVRPWYDGSTRQGESSLKTMPYILDVYVSAVDDVRVASVAAGALKTRIQEDCLSNASYYVAMGAVVDVIVYTTAESLSEVDFERNICVKLSARSPSVDPLTREAFEFASETYKLLPGVMSEAPSFDKVSEEHRVDLFSGWLLCRYSPIALEAKRQLKLRIIDVNQLFNNAQLQVQNKIPQSVLNVVSGMMEQGLNVEAGAVLCWALNFGTDRSYKLVWNNMGATFDRLELAMVTVADVDRSNVTYQIEYYGGDYVTYYGAYRLESEKPSLLLRAVRGMAIAEKRGADCFKFYVASLESEKKVSVTKRQEDMQV